MCLFWLEIAVDGHEEEKFNKHQYYTDDSNENKNINNKNTQISALNKKSLISSNANGEQKKTTFDNNISGFTTVLNCSVKNETIRNKNKSIQFSK